MGHHCTLFFVMNPVALSMIALFIEKITNRYLIILNAANHHKDTEWIKNHLLMDTAFLDLSKDTALIALQGPEAVSLISDLSKDNLQEVTKIPFQKSIDQ